MDTSIKIVVYFLLIGFSTFIVTPSLMKIMDADNDTSVLYSLTEEEEKQGADKKDEAKDIVVLNAAHFLVFAPFPDFRANNYIEEMQYIPHFDVLIPPPKPPLLIF